MAEVVTMPHLSDTMEEGVVSTWHKKVGDTVESGEIIADIETDKATMEFESFYDGVVLHLEAKEGEEVPVDAMIAIIGEEGEDISELLKKARSAGKDEAPEEKEKEEPAPTGESPKKAAPRAEKAAAPAATPAATDGRVKASPLAKRMAEEKGIDLSQVDGSGTDGRIVKRDIEEFKPGAAPARSPIGAMQEHYTEVKVSQMRKTIARRLAESKFTAPHFYLTVNVDMEHAMAARKLVNKAIEPERISFNDMVIKAVAMALRQHPAVNSSWQGDTIRMNDHVHIGVAVAVDEGLLVPVVRFADAKTLRQINAEVRDYAERAKDKKLQPEEWQGNTFTVSNLGMFDIDEFTAIINTPDACILAVGSINEVPVVKNGAVVPGHRMKITLSCDHRVVDGATGARFMQTLKAMLENPMLMIS